MKEGRKEAAMDGRTDGRRTKGENTFPHLKVKQTADSCSSVQWQNHPELRIFTCWGENYLR